jgi:hypothetical protein
MRVDTLKPRARRTAQVVGSPMRRNSWGYLRACRSFHASPDKAYARPGLTELLG